MLAGACTDAARSRLPWLLLDVLSVGLALLPLRLLLTGLWVLARSNVEDPVESDLIP
jgi:hypothetical protein